MTDLTTIQCSVCGIDFGLPRPYYLECGRWGDKKPFYCPNNHRLTYGDSEIEIAQREAARLKQQLAERDDTIHAERERAARAERETLRVKKRINAGVCTCCNRTFTNLARHMKTKHSDVSNVVPIKTGAKSA